VTTINPSITHATLCAALVDEFWHSYATIPSAHAATVTRHVVELDEEDIKTIPEVQQRHAELLSWDWTFGHTPDFTQTIHHLFPWGKVVRSSRYYSQS
jgi:lipoate-protein ligase A